MKFQAEIQATQKIPNDEARFIKIYDDGSAILMNREPECYTVILPPDAGQRFSVVCETISDTDDATFLTLGMFDAENMLEIEEYVEDLIRFIIGPSSTRFLIVDNEEEMLKLLILNSSTYTPELHDSIWAANAEMQYKTADEHCDNTDFQHLPGTVFQHSQEEETKLME